MSIELLLQMSSTVAPSTTTESPISAKSMPGFLEDFLADPRTTNLRLIHRTQIHVAMVVKRGKILAQASNRIGSRQKGIGYSDKTIHAERNCIKQLGDLTQLRGADLYVMRISKSPEKPEFLSSKPCHECEVFLEKCIREYGLKCVYYTS